MLLFVCQTSETCRLGRLWNQIQSTKVLYVIYDALD